MKGKASQAGNKLAGVGGLRPWKHSAGRSCDYRQKGSHTVFLNKTDAGSVPPVLPGSSLDGPCRCSYRSSELRLSSSDVGI